jgi:hypothetical protein
MRSLARVARIVQKFFPHEVSSEEVWGGLLLHTEKLRGPSVRTDDWEAVTLARLFQHLGYWSDNAASEIFFEESLEEEGISQEEKVKLVREINRILRTVHT